MKKEIKIVEYKKLIRNGNQYRLNIPKMIIDDIGYNRHKDTFKIVYIDGKLLITMIRDFEESDEE